MCFLQQPSNDPTEDKNSLSCRKAIQKVRTNLHVVRRGNDGFNEMLASKELAEKAALQGIGKLETF